MKRQALLLGLFSIGGQVLLLRELIRSFHGNELFIGTALFGWLIAVAAGAYWGGKISFHIKPSFLFVLGVILLPVLIVAVRLFPLLLSAVVGEFIPFSTAVIISTMVMLPIGFISGWLFPLITSRGRVQSESIAYVYLFEGIGAFVGGILVLLLTGGLLSTLQTACLLGLGIIAGQLQVFDLRKIVKCGIAVVVFILLYAGIYPLLAHVDRFIDHTKYRNYEIIKSFDTHYSHQTILSLDSSIILLTDNTIEAVYPNLESAEYMLVPPLAYHEDIGRVLMLGGSRLAIAAIIDSFPDLEVTIVDPRRKLQNEIDKLLPESNNITQINDDPVSYLTKRNSTRQYDIIIINPGDLDSYKNCRFFTDRILTRCRQLLHPNGILYIPTHYDTDRYITDETAQILAAVHTVLQNSFAHLTIWPGTNTLYFASQSPLFDISYDSLITKLDHLTYQPQYVNDYYLRDRLSDFRLERVNTMLHENYQTNSFNKPRLLHLQTIYRAKANSHDRQIIAATMSTSFWVAVIVIIFIVLLILIIRRKHHQSLSLFLYFTAGFVSLSVELAVFYIFQSTVGTLYSEMAVLIGAFMLGLAVGTAWAVNYGNKHLPAASLLFLLTAMVMFAITYNHIAVLASLMYFGLFLFAIAIATGGLFVGATNLLYQRQKQSNPGRGYALEILGSATGALFSTTVLLPAIGLTWLLVLLTGIIVIAFVGTLVTQE